MENGFLIVDINSISSTKEIMDSNYVELVNLITKYKEIIENTKNIYDTESGTLYRKIALSYIEIIVKYLNNEFKPYVDQLDKIKNTYIEEYNEISKSINNGGNI